MLRGLYEYISISMKIENVSEGKAKLIHFLNYHFMVLLRDKNHIANLFNAYGNRFI